jgi:chemotaxis protein methyltransferase CheR
MLNIALADATFRELRDYIYDNSGIFISDTKKYLIENRLSRILQEKNLSTFEEYLKSIKFSANGNELSRLFDAVTTNETYFFREPHQLDVFANDILPLVLKQKNGSLPLKIWSAACSSGEEPYTLAMMLLERSIPASRFRIFGSDLSQAVLDSASKAVFNSYSTRNIPAPLIKKYFNQEGQSLVLNDQIKKCVTFSKTNLIDRRQMGSLRGMDIIFCRNVLIYFDAKAKQQVVSNLYDSLNPGGYLFIGSSESLHNVTRAFRPSVANKVILYQKA